MVHKKIFLILPLIILLQILLLINSRYTIWPEMMLYPYLMNNGFKLYQDIVNPYFPLLSEILAFYFKIFGSSILNLKVITYLIVIITNLLVFWSSFKMTKDIRLALLSSIIYVLLGFSLGGNGLWFELALTPLVLTAMILVFLDSQERKRLFIAGILLALAVSIKQNAVLFYFPVLYLLIWRRNYKGVVSLLSAGILVFIFYLIKIYSSGNIVEFFQWSIVLPIQYSSQHGFIALPALRQYLLILIPAATLLGVKDLILKLQEKIFWTLVFLISISFAFPRFEDFHLQVLVVFSSIFAIMLPRKILALFLIIVLILFARSGVKLFNKPDRFLDNETIALSEKMRSYNSVYLLNGPDLAYFLAEKVPPKPWAINFPWYFENFNFEDKFIEGLMEEKTQYIFIGDGMGGGEYDLGNYFPPRLLNFINQNYTKKERFQNFWIWQRI